MTLELYQEVTLTRELPEYGLKAGDIATLIDFVAHPSSGEEGCVLEVFNAVVSCRLRCLKSAPTPSVKVGDRQREGCGSVELKSWQKGRKAKEVLVDWSSFSFYALKYLLRNSSLFSMSSAVLFAVNSSTARTCSPTE